MRWNNTMLHQYVSQYTMFTTHDVYQWNNVLGLTRQKIELSEADCWLWGQVNSKVVIHVLNAQHGSSCGGTIFKRLQSCFMFTHGLFKMITVLKLEWIGILPMFLGFPHLFCHLWGARYGAFYCKNIVTVPITKTLTV